MRVEASAVPDTTRGRGVVLYIGLHDPRRDALDGRAVAWAGWSLSPSVARRLARQLLAGATEAVRLRRKASR